MNNKDRCGTCRGGGLMPELGCTCTGSAHICVPAICTACMGSGVPVCVRSKGVGRVITVTRRHPLRARTCGGASQGATCTIS
jgi:hypothetical protein